MNPWLRRILYLLFFLFWLAIMAFPVVAFTLATNGELQLGGEQRHLRLFMVQEEGNQGVGIQWTRPQRGASTCIKTNLSYFMWEGEGQSSAFCQCFDPQTNASLSANSCTP